MQILTCQFRKFSWIVLLDGKAQTVAIKTHTPINIVRNVPDRCHAAFSSQTWRVATPLKVDQTQPAAFRDVRD